MSLRAVPPHPELEALERLEAAVPEVASVADGSEAEALQRLGAVALRLEALRAGLVARVLSSAKPATREPDKLLSVAETARRLGVSRDYVYEHQAELPLVKQGSRRLFSERGLERYLDARRIGRGGRRP